MYSWIYARLDYNTMDIDRWIVCYICDGVDNEKSGGGTYIGAERPGRLKERAYFFFLYPTFCYGTPP